MKKRLAVYLLLLALGEARGAQFGSLNAGATYRVLINGEETQTLEADKGVVSLGLPGGSASIGLSQEAEGSPLPSDEPTLLTLSDLDQEVFLASFEEITQTNRFTLLDRQGLQIVGPVEVLKGAHTEGKVLSTDLNGDGRLEVVASGYIPEIGVVMEYWTGEGSLAVRTEVFDVSFGTDNHLVPIDLGGEPGAEAMLIGRDPSGAYHVKTYDSMGAPLNQFVAFAGGYEGIDSILVEDVRGDGREEAVVLVRTIRNTVEMKVLSEGTVLSSAPLFGSGFVGAPVLFPVDLDGDGTSEIGVARKSVGADSHRLIVLGWSGNVLLKTNVLMGKYEEDAVFCAANLDADGGEEIGVVGRLVETGANILEILDDTGKVLSTREVLATSFNGALTELCADLNGDSITEIVVGGKDSETGIVAYQVVGPTGEVTSGGTFFESGVDYEAALFRADIDMDGEEELLAVGEFSEGRYRLEMRDGSSGLMRFAADFWETPMELAEGELVN